MPQYTERAVTVFGQYNADGSPKQPGANADRWGTEVERAIESIPSGVDYQGTWDANANSPTIPAASSGNRGHFYYVAVPGSTTINDISTWEIGDRLISNGSVWTRVPADSPYADILAAVQAQVDDITANIPEFERSTGAHDVIFRDDTGQDYFHQETRMISGSAVARLAGSGNILTLSEANNRREWVTTDGRPVVSIEPNETMPRFGPILPYDTPHVGVTDAAIAALNDTLPDYPSDAAPPPLYSNDVSAYGTRTAHLAASIAITGSRFWVIFYGSNTAAADAGFSGWAILQYCDNLETGIWHQVLFLVPYDPELARVQDPFVTALPDGRLAVFLHSDVGSSRRRGAYGFVIANPEAKVGGFDVGRMQWLDYGLASFVHNAGGELRLSVDEWAIGAGPFTNGEGRHYSRLVFDGRDGMSTERISTMTYDGPELETFPETSVVTLSGGRTRAWYRSLGGLDGQGIRTVLSDPGDLTWGASEPWTDYPTPSSRACFKRSPSGRIVAAFNDIPGIRYKMSLALSEDDGETFPWVLRMDDSQLASQPTSYPDMTFDNAGNIYLIYEFGRTPSAPLGKQIVIQVVAEQAIRDQSIHAASALRYTIAI